MNTQQGYEYFDGEGQICQGNEEILLLDPYRWKQSGRIKGDYLSSIHKYRRPINYFTKEYQAELAKQWVLEGGFERECKPSAHTPNWSDDLAYPNMWVVDCYYCRKPQPTQEELDAQAAKEYSKTATIQPDTTVIEKAYMEGMKHERNRNK